MKEKKMTLGELVGWLDDMDDDDVSYSEIDDAGKLTVEGNLGRGFMDWVRTRKYTNLPDELVHVDGTLWLERTSMMSLGGLTSVGRDLDLQGTPIASLGNLTSVGEFLDLRNTSITSLGNLTSVGGSLDLEGAPITSLGDLTSVGGYLDLWDTPITFLGNLTSVGGSLALRGTPITSLGNLTSVGGSLDLQYTPLTSLDNLASVGGWLDLSGTSVTSLDGLPQVRDHIYLDQSQFQLLTREALQKVKGEILHWDQAAEKWIALSPDELEVIVAENERRESLHNTRGSDVDWDLYGR